jgi:hypothetical protein
MTLFFSFWEMVGHYLSLVWHSSHRGECGNSQKNERIGINCVGKEENRLFGFRQGSFSP